jgi:hypothetical protein
MTLYLLRTVSVSGLFICMPISFFGQSVPSTGIWILQILIRILSLQTLWLHADDICAVIWLVC